MSVASMAAGERLRLCWQPFSFPLPVPLRTAAGRCCERRGWLLRLETAAGVLGWGEASPLAMDSGQERARIACARALEDLGATWARADLEERLSALPPALAFALGAALAEVEGLVGPAAGGWRPAPPSAWLLPAGPAALERAREILDSLAAAPGPLGANATVAAPQEGEAAACSRQIPLTLKWKVGVHPEAEERAWYRRLAALLPPGARLRLDANGGFDRATAWRWADELRGDERLEWLEQPLDPADQRGLEELAKQLPVALDESLRQRPDLVQRWPGWQVRRPSQEGDPRPLLRDLRAGRPWLMVSTALETGVGLRWLAHLAALQAAGPTPTAPGLAPGWGAPEPLAAEAPEAVWAAARAG